MPQSSSRRQFSNCVFHRAQTAPRSPSNRAVGALRWGWSRTVNVQLTNPHNGRIFLSCQYGPKSLWGEGLQQNCLLWESISGFQAGHPVYPQKGNVTFFSAAALHFVLLIWPCCLWLVLKQFYVLFWKCFIAVFIVDNFPWRLIKYADS